MYFWSFLLTIVTAIPHDTCANEFRAHPERDHQICFLTPGDLVRLENGHEDTRPIRIDPRGALTLPLIGELDALNRTPRQLATEIATHLQKFVNNSRVTITLVDPLRKD